MLTLWSDRTECLWEESLPVEVKQLPDDLAALDRVLSGPRLLGPIVARWRREFRTASRSLKSSQLRSGGIKCESYFS
jgi:hypothetical protein